MPPRPRDADVEQPPLLVDSAPPARRIGSSPSSRRGRKHGLELEPLRPVQRQQVHAAAGARAEPRLAGRRRTPRPCGRRRRTPARAARAAQGRPAASARARRASRAARASSPCSSAVRARRRATSVASLPRSAFSSLRAASRSSSDAPWNGIPASWNASSKSAARAFVRTSTACSSSGTPSAAARARAPRPPRPGRTRAGRRAPGRRRASPASVFSEPPSLAVSRFASASTCGVDR